TPPRPPRTLPNCRDCRAVESQDFDDLMEDGLATYKAVVFNPVSVPADEPRHPPRFSLLGPRRRFPTRANLWPNGQVPPRSHTGTSTTSSVAKGDGCHAPVTAARWYWRPPSANERSDDLQFYVPVEAELMIDDN